MFVMQSRLSSYVGKVMQSRRFCYNAIETAMLQLKFNAIETRKMLHAIETILNNAKVLCNRDVHVNNIAQFNIYSK